MGGETFLNNNWILLKFNISLMSDGILFLLDIMSNRFWKIICSHGDPAVSWVDVFVAKVSGIRLLVIVTEDFVLDVAGVLYSLLFTHIC